MVVIVLVAGQFLPAARADDFSQRNRIYSVLASPMNSIIEGKAFRDGMQGIAKQAGLNVWIDRRVDPTRPVASGPLGPTVYSAISKLAAQRDCVLMPVANVLLVGRPDWVDQTTSAIMSLRTNRNQVAADIHWEDLTTPAEAIAIAANTAVTVDPALPHDLWPATTWKQIDRRVAVALVLAQVDRQPRSTASLRSLQALPATTKSFSRRYSFGDANATIRGTMHDADRSCRFRTDQRWLEATGSATAHRRAVTQLFETLPKVAAPDPNKAQFTLKPTSTTAENLFFNFARMAKRKCEIKDNAAAACKKIISIEAKDNTLQQLSDIVAEQIGVNVKWLDDRIVVSKKQG